jgi:LysR family transcriptional regulator, hydrogen peroxide-inducible genes activator
MEMHQIRYFLAVCETLNFTRAAEQCHVTQPALTRAVQKLEEELGGLLFRRERHLTHLTDLGRLIQPQLEQIWKETEAAKTTAKSFLKLENAPLNLGIMCTIGPLRGISFVTDFWRSNQGIEITLREGVPPKTWRAAARRRARSRGYGPVGAVRRALQRGAVIPGALRRRLPARTSLRGPERDRHGRC